MLRPQRNTPGRTQRSGSSNGSLAANALDDWRFSEWIGPDGPDGAAHQTWNAGTFLYAWSMVKG